MEIPVVFATDENYIFYTVTALTSPRIHILIQVRDVRPFPPCFPFLFCQKVDPQVSDPRYVLTFHLPRRIRSTESMC